MPLHQPFAVVTVVALGLGSVACSQRAAPQDTARLLATDRAWAALSAAGKDADSVVSYWTDDARVAVPGQPLIAGKTAIRQMVTGMFKIPGFHITWTPDSAAISGDGSMGYTWGTTTVTEPDSAGMVTRRSSYLTVWRKDASGRWHCVADYSTPGPA